MRVIARFVAVLTLLLWRVTAAAGAPLALDAQRSTIEVEVQGTFGSFTGRLQQFEAMVSIDPAGPSIERAEVDFRFADLRTGRERRDRDMMEWENHAQHPAVHFQLERLVIASDGPQRARTQARGRLTMHGMEHSVIFPITVLIEGMVCSIDGEVDLDYREYGLPVIRKYFILTVDPHLRVRFHLQGRLVTPAPILVIQPDRK